MAKRRKIFYPEYQITNDLFTKGKEWMTLDDWKEYSGFYHSYTTGEVYTEKKWDPVKSRRLIRYKEQSEDYFKYLDLKQYTVFSTGEKRKVLGATTQYYRYVAPRVVKRIPTTAEVNNGNMNRYFVYKRNEPERVFFEVDEAQVQDFTALNRGINHFLYGLVTVGWKIGGPEFDVYKGDLLVTPGVVDTNRRIVLRNSQKFPILAKLLRNLREFSQYDV